MIRPEAAMGGLARMADDVLVLIDVAEGVGKIELNRPKKRNALNSALQAHLVEALDGFARDDRVACVLLSGAGPSFCAGHDLTEGLATTPPDPVAFFDMARDFYMAVWRFPKPLVIAAHGFVGPAGIELLLLADIVVAGESTVCSYEMLRAGGVTPAFFLPWIVGPRAAKEILLTAPRLDAARARELGIVNVVVPDDAVSERALAAAHLVAVMPSLHTRLSKLLVNSAIEAMGAAPLSALATSVEALARLTLTGTLALASQEGLGAVLAEQESRFQRLVAAWQGEPASG